MAKIIVFPLTLRPPPTGRPFRKISTIKLFPLRLQSGFVEHVVRQLKALPTQQQRDECMVRIIEAEFNDQAELGLDDHLVERNLIEFADRVWSLVRGEQRGGAA